MADDDFRPVLGRIRAPASKRGRRYLQRVLTASVLAGLGSAGRGRTRFDGSRIGRGAGLGRLLGSRDRYGGLRARRAIVKTRLVRLGTKGLGAARAHLRYIQRDGVQRDGSPGQSYSAREDHADGKAFLERCHGDRHQFRLIVSAEDGDAYSDLKPLVRRFMAQMEKDLGTKLDWVAVDHVDTGQPHTHIILRGRDELGQNLVIAREYISHGMRERVAELVTLDLGPRQDWEIQQRLRRDLDAERLTSTDRALLRDMDAQRQIAAGHRDPFRHSLRAGRLKKLEGMGLAEPLGGGRWRLADGLEEKLRRMGERGDIIRTMQRELSTRGIERAPADRLIHEEVAPAGIVGRVVARGLSDEQSGRQYLIVDGLDGRAHHLDIGSGDTVETMGDGTIVRVSQAPVGVRSSDRVIAEVAAANGGRYSIELHMLHDPAAREDFADAHVRRLEAVRRAGGKVERLDDGSWVVGTDYLEQAAAYERRRARAAPVRVEVLSPVPLERLAGHKGATWLDRQLADEAPELVRDSGFGCEVRSAVALRRQWLLAQGLADEIDGEFRLRPGVLASLRQRALSAAAAQLGSELAMPFAPVADGERVEGRLVRRVDLASGRFALVENGRDFTLVPWRPVLEAHVGRDVSGAVRGDRVSWTIGRSRSIER